MDSNLTIRDVVETEMEQLELYGEAAVEFFQGLAGDIRRDFTETLDGLLTQELPAFQQQVSRSLSAATGIADIVGDALGGGLGSLTSNAPFGDVFGAALSGALRTVLSDVSRGNGVNLGRVVRGASRAGNTQFDRATRNGGGLVFSASQQGAQAWESLNRGQRNL